MAIVKAKTIIQGSRGSAEEVALVDTGSTYTLINRKLAQEIGVKFTGRRMKVIVADGHEIIGDLAIIDELIVEDELLPFAHVLVIDFPGELTKRLESLGLSKQIILGLLTIEALGLIPDTAIGRLKKVGALLIQRHSHIL